MNIKKSQKLITLVGFLLLANLLFTSSVYADVMNPEYLTKKCNLGDREFVCHYNSERPFGPKNSDECKKYENNPKYYYLGGQGSSFGGEKKYCLNAGLSDYVSNIKNKFLILKNHIFVGGIVGVVAVISLLALFLLRKKGVNQ